MSKRICLTTGFLSTPSARRATADYKYEHCDGNCISIHALREEGDRYLYRFIADFGMISIHALREEGDATQTRSDSKET